MRRLSDGGAELRVFETSNQSDVPDFVIDGSDGDLQKAETKATLGPLKDRATFELVNDGGKYRVGEKTIHSGYRVEYWVKFAPSAEFKRRFTGIVRSPSIEITGANTSVLKFTVEDFVGAILSWRLVEAGFQKRHIVGEPFTEAGRDAILNMVLADECPEIDRSGLIPVDERASVRYNGEYVIDIVRNLVARTDLLLWSSGRTLVMRMLGDVEDEFVVQSEDLALPSFSVNDNDLRNDVRIDGGSARRVQDFQNEQTDYFTVTKSERLIYKIDVPKSEVSGIDVWTDANRSGSADGITVRLQKDAGGAPVDVEASQLDMVRRTLASPFIEGTGSSGGGGPGYTFFDLPGNDVIESDPWLIIEGDDSGDKQGQPVGVNAAGVPTYASYYSFPVAVQDSIPESVEQFRRRDFQTSVESADSFEEASVALETQLKQRSVMERSVSVESDSIRFHELEPGDGAYLDLPQAGYSGSMVVTSVKESLDGALMHTEFELHSLDSVSSVSGAL